MSETADRLAEQIAQAQRLREKWLMFQRAERDARTAYGKALVELAKARNAAMQSGPAQPC